MRLRIFRPVAPILAAVALAFGALGLIVAIPVAAGAQTTTCPTNPYPPHGTIVSCAPTTTGPGTQSGTIPGATVTTVSTATTVTPAKAAALPTSAAGTHGGALAFTGSNAGRLVLIAIVLLLLGILIIKLNRLRHPHH